MVKRTNHRLDAMQFDAELSTGSKLGAYLQPRVHEYRLTRTQLLTCLSSASFSEGRQGLQWVESFV